MLRLVRSVFFGVASTAANGRPYGAGGATRALGIVP
jgi:hypothetical protein